MFSSNILPVAIAHYILVYSTIVCYSRLSYTRSCFCLHALEMPGKVQEDALLATNISSNPVYVVPSSARRLTNPRHVSMGPLFTIVIEESPKPTQDPNEPSTPHPHSSSHNPKCSSYIYLNTRPKSPQPPSPKALTAKAEGRRGFGPKRIPEASAEAGAQLPSLGAGGEGRAPEFAIRILRGYRV